MVFATNFSRPARKSERFSEKYQPVYKQEINKKTGERELVQVDSVDIYSKIQEYKDDVTISSMLQKYSLNFHEQLKFDEKNIIDLTNMPENLLETLTTIDNAKYIWERQSKELKNKFNNDFKQFIASSENGQLAKLLNEELKTTAEKFNTSNMANYDKQFAPLQSYLDKSTIQPSTQVTPTVEPTTPVFPAQTQTQYNLGGNTNV